MFRVDIYADNRLIFWNTVRSYRYAWKWCKSIFDANPVLTYRHIDVKIQDIFEAGERDVF